MPAPLRFGIEPIGLWPSPGKNPATPGDILQSKAPKRPLLGRGNDEFVYRNSLLYHEVLKSDNGLLIAQPVIRMNIGNVQPLPGKQIVHLWKGTFFVTESAGKPVKFYQTRKVMDDQVFAVPVMTFPVFEQGKKFEVVA